MTKRKIDINKLPIKDSTRDLVLSITEADIKNATRADNDDCAGARALCRQEGYKRARVFKTKTYVWLADGSLLRFVTPQSLYTELMVFDRGGRFEAGDYVLKAPKGMNRLGARTKPRWSRTKTGRKAPIHIVTKVRDDAPKGRNAMKALFE